MTTRPSTPTDRPVDATPQDAPLDQPVVLPRDPAAAPAPAPEATDGGSGSWTLPPALLAAVPMIATGLALLTHQWVFYLMIPAVMMLFRGGCWGGRR